MSRDTTAHSSIQNNLGATQLNIQLSIHGAVHTMCIYIYIYIMCIYTHSVHIPTTCVYMYIHTHAHIYEDEHVYESPVGLREAHIRATKPTQFDTPLFTMRLHRIRPPGSRLRDALMAFARQIVTRNMHNRSIPTRPPACTASEDCCKSRALAGRHELCCQCAVSRHYLTTGINSCGRFELRSCCNSSDVQGRLP